MYMLFGPAHVWYPVISRMSYPVTVLILGSKCGDIASDVKATINDCVVEPTCMSRQQTVTPLIWKCLISVHKMLRDSIGQIGNIYIYIYMYAD